MKRSVFILLALAGLAGSALAAGPDSFDCLRPDGSVVCSVDAPSGDPSVACNQSCNDCNLVCKARQMVIREGRRVALYPAPAARVEVITPIAPQPAEPIHPESIVPSAPAPVAPASPEVLTPVAPEVVVPGGAYRGPSRETPETCRRMYADCISRCRTDPANAAAYDLDACYSSCDSARSGCGTRP